MNLLAHTNSTRVYSGRQCVTLGRGHDEDPPQLSVRLDSAAPLSPASSSGADTQLASGAHAAGLSGPGQLEQLQEGNDIYLTCSLEANPRPVKPILWRAGCPWIWCA